jgi:hypothetical protein
MLWIAWAVTLAVARTEKKSSGSTANNRITQSINSLLSHMLVVRLSPISPTESSVHGWWIPRRQKQREPAIGRTNNIDMELIECIRERS